MTFIGYVEAETDRALLFQDHWWHYAEWLPKTQISVLHDFDTHEVMVQASPWICGVKNLIEFKERKEKPEMRGI